MNQPSKPEMSSDVAVYITNVYKMRLLNKRFKHYVKSNSSHEEEIKEFPPTRFLYSFMVLNGLSNIDWDGTSKSGKLEYQDRNFSEMMKINKVVEFFLSNDEFSAIIDILCNEVFSKDTEALKSMKILADVRSKRKFLNSVKKFEQGEISSISLEDIIIILNVIYKVRCNVFHGTKTTVLSPDEDQLRRFEIYADILDSITGEIFRSLNIKGFWRILDDERYIGK